MEKNDDKANVLNRRYVSSSMHASKGYGRCRFANILRARPYFLQKLTFEVFAQISAGCPKKVMLAVQELYFDCPGF